MPYSLHQLMQKKPDCFAQDNEQDCKTECLQSCINAGNRPEVCRNLETVKSCTKFCTMTCPEHETKSVFRNTELYQIWQEQYARQLNSLQNKS